MAARCSGGDELHPVPKAAGLETSSTGEPALVEPKGPSPPTAGANEELHPPPVRKWMCCRPTVKATSPNKTVVALSRGPIAPDARIRDTPTPGKSSIACLMGRETNPLMAFLQQTKF